MTAKREPTGGSPRPWWWRCSPSPGDRFSAGGGYVEPETPRVPADCRTGADPDVIAVIQRAETVSRR